jgi:hypothetical protein
MVTLGVTDGSRNWVITAGQAAGVESCRARHFLKNPRVSIGWVKRSPAMNAGDRFTAPLRDGIVLVR